MGDVSHMSCNDFPLTNSRVDQMIQLSSECKYHVLVAWRFIQDIGRQEPGVFMSQSIVEMSGVVPNKAPSKAERQVCYYYDPRITCPGCVLFNISRMEHPLYLLESMSSIVFLGTSNSYMILSSLIWSNTNSSNYSEQMMCGPLWCICLDSSVYQSKCLITRYRAENCQLKDSERLNHL